MSIKGTAIIVPKGKAPKGKVWRCAICDKWFSDEEARKVEPTLLHERTLARGCKKCVHDLNKRGEENVK